jgi:hypothetical protein
VHFLYVDEAGSTGANLADPQQPVFVMASVIVSDEKWRTTNELVREKLQSYFGAPLSPGFELHACELLSPDGDGPFAGDDRQKRSQLALDLLAVIGQRGHYVFHVPVYKSTLASTAEPDKDWGFGWLHPWEFAFAFQVTMFEEFLRSTSTGASSTGLVIVDHEDACVDFVREHTANRQSDTGWKELKKVVEIGYSAASHANSLIQLTDLVAFTLKKYYELDTPNGASWPPAAKDFFSECKSVMWPRVKFKNPSFTKLNVHASMLDHAKAVRKS